jgi:two-component system response regulator FixJ
VDDDPSLLSTMAAALEDDVDVDICSSPLAALQRLAQTPFHVVCTDLHMPQMDGVELLRRITVQAEPTACILLTGNAAAVNPRALPGADLVSVVEKPYDLDRLLTLLLQLARLTELRRGARRL